MEQREERLLFEIKQLKQTVEVMRGVIKRQEEKIDTYDKILIDWLTYERERVNSLLPPNKE